ncbi:hypothetical protein B0H13DRAFT_2682265 [Mycena leptocephala]|nr:hypothetical protein B0H13DRAFT_2682265 [Mycena leptocephala]
MPSIYSRPSFPSTFLQALWRLVRMLFGAAAASRTQKVGTASPSRRAPPRRRRKGAVATYRPTPGIPLGLVFDGRRGFAPEAVRSRRFLPWRAGDPLPEDKQAQPEKSADVEPQLDRLPLRAITNGPKRVHGKTPPKRRPRAAPSPPRISRVDSHPSILITPVPTEPVVKAAEPGSFEWKREKTLQLKQARAWSDAIKARRRSLPVPPPPTPPASIQLARRASAPARLSLLNGSASPSQAAPLQHPHPHPLSFRFAELPAPSPSTSLTSLTASSSFSSLLHFFNSGRLRGRLQGAAWLGLRQLADLGDNESRTVNGLNWEMALARSMATTPRRHSG